MSTTTYAWLALLFPLAHLSGVPAALVGGDVIFLAAFWMLARRMATANAQPPTSNSQAGHQTR